jgi:enoyl-[acyl-carrier protein] reductase III
MSLEGRRALVTGGSGDIGRAICADLARRGADVALTYFRDEAAAGETRAAVEAEGRSAVVLQSRLDAGASCRRAVDDAAAALGGLDILISNAATGVNRPALDVTEKHWDWTLNTNARALLLLTQAAVPHMVEGGGGAIVALSSLGSHRVLPNYSLVGISKAALEAAIRYLGVELAPRGIRVNAVSGALVESGALDHFPNGEQMRRDARERTPAGRMLVAADVANAVAWLCGDESAMVIGQTLIVDGGYSLPA